MKHFVKNFGKKNKNNSNANKKLIKIMEKIKLDQKISKYQYVFIANMDLKNIKEDTWDKVKEKKNYWLIDKETFDLFKINWFIKKIPPNEIKSKIPSIYIRNDEIIENDIEENSEVQVLIIKSTAIINSFKKHKNELFDLNVRYYLGKGEKVNKSIKKTIEENKDYRNFAKFNNGITIVCKKIEKNDNSSFYTLWDAQIINGAQTTVTLSNINDEEILEKINIPIKIICEKNSNREIINKIAKFSNSQNSISERDLYSNGEEQIKLQKYFLKKQILLEIKREEFKKNKIFKNFIFLKNELIGQIFLSTILNKPWNAKNRKSKIFKDEELYNSIFKERNVTTHYKLYKIWEKINKFLKNSDISSKLINFNFILLNIIFKRIKNVKNNIEFESISENDINLILKNIKNLKMKDILNKLFDYLKMKDFNLENEEKTPRELSISPKLEELIPNFYKKINW